MNVPCQKEHGPYEWGIGDIYWKLWPCSKSKMCTKWSTIGDGLDPWKVVKNMNFEFVTGCAMAYVCPKSYAKNLGFLKILSPRLY
jgi:hypothetical protein